MNAIKQWRREFARLESVCPWPGPRPLSPRREDDRRGLLVGRDETTRVFLEMVRQHSLVVLHGDSGVGKSSLLNVGLVTALRAMDYVPLVCWDWAGVGESTSPEQFVADKLRSQGDLDAEVLQRLDAGEQLVEVLDNLYEDGGVLVLDQFEELIRYQPERFASMVDWLVSMNQRYRVKVVLSLRSEYVHRLKDLNSHVRPYSMAYTALVALDSRAEIEAVIHSADSPTSTAITSEATRVLLDEWDSLVRTSPIRTLLHLQATLMALHARATAGGRSQVILDDVVGLRREATARGLAASTDSDRVSLFITGFDEAIALKLDRCAEACRGLDAVIDPVLIEGARAQVRESVTHLSSGGYKLVREHWDLAERTLRRELDVLCAREGETYLPSRGEAERLLRTLSALQSDDSVDVLSIGRSEIVVAAGLDWNDKPAEEAWYAETLATMGVTPVPWVTDPLDLSSGMMLGLGPRAVLVEELRRFTFAIEWLKAASLIRASTPEPNQTRISLIHDGFCDALEGWARRLVDSPAASVAALTAIEGARFLWLRQDGSRWPDFEGNATQPSFLVNLRWRYCTVTADFKRIAFVNCDLRGVRFIGCRFEGVVLINCLLDGASFEECDVVGQAVVSDSGVPAYLEDTLGTGVRSSADPLPEFVIQVEPRVVRNLNHYRKSDTETDQLYSATSGVAAVPWSSPTPKAVPWEQQQGGMTMYGGRLSSLMIRNCSFHDGMLALCHIAGSSLNVVEQATGAFLITYSTIRGLTVTRRVGDASPPQQPLAIEVSNCVLADTWFGEDLVGQATFRNTRLWHLMNTSSTQDLRILVDDCSYHGLVNVSDVTENCSNLPGYERDGIADRMGLVAVARTMSYRSVPARLELERRAGLAPRREHEG